MSQQEYYNSNNIEKMCEEAIKKLPGRFFYCYPSEKDKSESYLVNYRSRTTDNGMYCTEIAAKYVIEHFDEFIEQIPKITRNKTYKTKSHTGGKSGFESERKVAQKLFEQCKDGSSFDFIGKIIDYETPLQNTNQDTGFGNIDLLSVNEKDKTVYILELKKNGSTETLLRCVLEGFTYSMIVNQTKLLNDFGYSGYNIRVAPLVFEGKDQWKEYKEMKEGNRPYLMKLMEKLNIRPFFLVGPSEDGKYMVTDK